MRYLLFILLLVPSLSQSQGTVDEYVSWMSGTFDSFEHAQQDPSFWDVVISHEVILHDDDTYWIDVDQGLPDGRIYRERLYKIFENDSTIVTQIYKRENGKLVHLKGCDLYIYKIGDAYFGRTSNFDCKSSYGGASYLTTSFRVYRQRIESWERGWNSDGRQVWGSGKGYFIFKKQTNR